MSTFGRPAPVPTPPRFVSLITWITALIEGLPLDESLEHILESAFPVNGPVFNEIEALCRTGVAEGWLCAREADGIRFGRPVKPGLETHGFSVDVVEMTDVVGPHHAHPNGEIDMIMPLDEAAAFDGRPRGWKVYEAGTAHRPTVTGGRALVLYLLPEGAIVFSTA